MVDSVSSLVVVNGPLNYVVNLTNVSDGTGESAVVKVDKSTLVAIGGAEPTRLVVERIQYDVSNMRVAFYWDHTTDVPIAVVQGSGFLDWRDVGGLVDNGTGDTGDILLTTTGHAAGEGYTITLYCRKQP